MNLIIKMLIGFSIIFLVIGLSYYWFNKEKTKNFLIGAFISFFLGLIIDVFIKIQV